MMERLQIVADSADFRGAARPATIVKACRSLLTARIPRPSAGHTSPAAQAGGSALPKNIAVHKSTPQRPQSAQDSPRTGAESFVFSAT